jgi:hypothetical protein
VWGDIGGDNSVDREALLDISAAFDFVCTKESTEENEPEGVRDMAMLTGELNMSARFDSGGERSELMEN